MGFVQTKKTIQPLARTLLNSSSYTRFDNNSIGWVRYRFPDPEQARIATILSHFAFFSGVGRKTALGMGQAMVDK